MSHSRSSLLDLPPFSLPQLLPSLLLPSRGDRQPPDPRTAGLFGRMAIQSPLTGCEPNAIVAVPRLLPFTNHQGGQVFAQYTIPVRTPHLRPCPSEVNERQSIGRPPSPLLMQKREASAFPARMYHSDRERSVSRSSHIPSTKKPVATHSHKRKSSRGTRTVQETHRTSERIRHEQQEVRDFLKFWADEAVEGEQEALSKLSEAEIHAELLLEEQRNQILSEANFEIVMQKSRAERSDDVIRELNRNAFSSSGN